MAGILNLQTGALVNGIGDFVLAMILVAIPVLFLGVKRLTIDRSKDVLWLTNHALLRHSQEEFRLSDIEELALVDRTTGTSGPKDLSLGEEHVAVRNARGRLSNQN